MRGTRDPRRLHDEGKRVVSVQAAIRRACAHPRGGARRDDAVDLRHDGRSGIQVALTLLRAANGARQAPDDHRARAVPYGRSDMM